MDLNRILYDESGQGLVEYSLILSLIIIGAIGSLFLFGLSLTELYERIKSNVEGIL